MYYIGIDLGTSAVSFCLWRNPEKSVICIKEYPLFFLIRLVGTESAGWFAQSMEGMKELTKDIDRKEVAGIGFGGQMHGLVTLDENDQVIRPAILWNDGRTQEETEYLNNEIGKNKLSEYTANIAFAGFTAPKILWMKKNEPDKLPTSQRSCCQRITLHIVCQVLSAQTFPMLPECFFWMLRTAAGQRK